MIYLLSIKNFKALVPLQLGVTNKQTLILTSVAILNFKLQFYLCGNLTQDITAALHAAIANFKFNFAFDC